MQVAINFKKRFTNLNLDNGLYRKLNQNSPIDLVSANIYLPE